MAQTCHWLPGTPFRLTAVQNWISRCRLLADERGQNTSCISPSGPFTLFSSPDKMSAGPHHSVFDTLLSWPSHTVLSMRASERPVGCILLGRYFTDCRLTPFTVLSSRDPKMIEKKLWSPEAQPHEVAHGTVLSPFFLKIPLDL